jgi:hypothetical protein
LAGGNETGVLVNETSDDLTIRNPARLRPADAGFGAATGAQNMRNLQCRC